MACFVVHRSVTDNPRNKTKFSPTTHDFDHWLGNTLFAPCLSIRRPEISQFLHLAETLRLQLESANLSLNEQHAVSVTLRNWGSNSTRIARSTEAVTQFTLRGQGI